MPQRTRVPLRAPLRTATAAAVLVAAAALVPVAGPSASASVTAAPALGPLPPLPLLSAPAADTLRVRVERSGSPEADGDFRLECGAPPGGTHPAAASACRRLRQLAQAGENPFSPVPQGQMCTQLYGGPATARVTGTWQGHRVDARFSRINGCETDRWDNLRPVLPLTRV
ncbi:SSI family serine proteinase inhibitor [Streptomyces sp. NPDC048717]|uniref:SSI family serine proteinase inhibitor n=1 Tax=Streptomyces sp. NPDC048717 TaxID=3154928 RepID=UPI00344786F7